MDNWIRVKLDKFETSKEDSWKKKTKKGRNNLNSKYAHCDRGSYVLGEKHQYIDKPSELHEPSDLPNNEGKCKIIDDTSKRTLSRFLKEIRHEHCVEVVDSLVKTKENGLLEMQKDQGSVPIIAGIQVTSKREDPRTPIDYMDIEF